MGAKSDNVSGLAGAWKRVRYILIDRSGPRAEFDTWHDAYEFMAASQVQGGSIVRSDASEAASQTGQPASASATNPPALQAHDEASSKKVLIVEDEVFTLLSMTQMVKGDGHEAVIARDADEGVAAIRLDRPDVMVVDVNLSSTGEGWNGFDLIDWL